MDNSKVDMSGTCGFKDAEMWYKRDQGEISEEEYDTYWNKYCSKCLYMCEICMCGETPEGDNDGRR